MKNIYIIKHYWDEKTYGATITPKWLFSKPDLTKEEKKIRETMKHYTRLSKYNELSSKKPSFEKFENLFIYFCYKDKNDPDPTNKRKVTDITFIISPKELKNPCELKDKNQSIIPLPKQYVYIFYVIAFILILFATIFMFNKKTAPTNQNLSPHKNEKTTSIQKTIEEKTEPIKPQPKKKIKKINKTKLMCQRYNNILTNPPKCYQKFFEDVCNKNYKNSYNQWLKNDKICHSMVGNINNDEELKQQNSEFQKFIKGFPNE